jgi:hypothetical protein
MAYHIKTKREKHPGSVECEDNATFPSLASVSAFFASALSAATKRESFNAIKRSNFDHKNSEK